MTKYTTNILLKSYKISARYWENPMLPQCTILKTVLHVVTALYYYQLIKQPITRVVVVACYIPVQAPFVVHSCKIYLRYGSCDVK